MSMCLVDKNRFHHEILISAEKAFAISGPNVGVAKNFKSPGEARDLLTLIPSLPPWCPGCQASR